MKNIITIISFVFLTNSCDTHFSEPVVSLTNKTDTISFNSYYALNGKITFSFNHGINLKLDETDTLITHFFKPPSVIFDQTNGFGNSNPYIVLKSNAFFYNFETNNEGLLIHGNSYSGKIEKKILEENVLKQHYFHNTIRVVYPNAKLLNMTLAEEKDYFEEFVEFITTYNEKKSVKFCYHSYKTFFYKSEGVIVRTLYLKRNLERKDIWPTAQAYKINNHYVRLFDSIPEIVKYR